MKAQVDLLLDTVDWKPIDGEPVCESSLPHATHEGTLVIGGFPLKVVQLSDGQRVIEAESLAKFFGCEVTDG